jgi:hypothetical protein
LENCATPAGLNPGSSEEAKFANGTKIPVGHELADIAGDGLLAIDSNDDRMILPDSILEAFEICLHQPGS